MKTVPTLCATSTGIGISVLGLALARPDHDRPKRRRSPDDNNNNNAHNNVSSRPILDPGHLRPLLPPPFPGPSDMTSTATCTVHTVDTYATPASFSSPFGFSARQSLRSASSPSTAPPKHALDNARTTLKKELRSRDGRTMPTGSDDSGEASPLSSSFAPHQSWLKRISFSSRDSSQHSNPRPESTLLSPSNGSAGRAASGSTTPVIPLQPPPTSAPNKLVKRSTSRGGRERSGSVSKIPLPTLRRPATSHQRSATLQEKRHSATPSAEDAFRHSFVASSTDSEADPQWRSFFTPRMAVGPAVLTKRRNSTGIPNPIKRVYPDRKYHPVLLSAKEPINAAIAEFDAEADQKREPVTSPSLVSEVQGHFSTPPFARPASVHVPFPSKRFSDADGDVRNYSHDSVRQSEIKEVEGGGDDPAAESASGRSFSISDLLPTDPQPWKQSTPGVNVPIAKYRRRGNRSSLGVRSSMGNKQSIPNDEPQPPSKRRDVGNVAQTSASSRPSNHLTAVDLDLSSHMSQSSTAIHPTSNDFADRKSRDRSSSAERNALPSPDSHPATSQPSHPTPYTDLTSNFAGSDSEIRSGDDEALDSQGETIYDSVRTKTTKGSPGRRGPPIETIFGESPPFHIHGKHTMLRDFLQHGPLHEHGYSLKPRHSIIPEEENTSTPARSARQQSANNSPVFQFKASPLPADIPSSPPTMPSLLDLRQSTERFPNVDDDEESSWSFDDGNDEERAPQPPTQNRFAHLGITSDLLSPFPQQSSSSPANTPQRYPPKPADKDVRSCIFDWSEQQPLDKSPGNRSPPRPKTVHGKKDAENRGSRSVGRRAPSGVHARSQSVPVAQEADGKRSQVVTNKFGTWGIGSKGVTEDWNEDFDFDYGEAQAVVTTLTPGEEKRLDSGVGMFVPKSIRDQQTNVLANIGLLRDWGLLIEELKELKTRAIALELLDGENKNTWNEVDAMIDLADHESDEHTLAPRYSPPSSPSFNYEEFDEPLPTTSTTCQHTPEGIASLSVPSSPQIAEFDIFDIEHDATPPHVEHEVRIIPATPQRPRKDSEAVARSVIEALQQKRVASDTGPSPEERLDKVHFDTATLKRIIPYVQELRDRIKKLIRNAEDLLPSPQSLGSIGSSGNNTLRRRLRETQESPTMRRRSRRSTNNVENASSDDGFQSPTDDLAAHMRLMTVI